MKCSECKLDFQDADLQLISWQGGYITACEACVRKRLSRPTLPVEQMVRDACRLEKAGGIYSTPYVLDVCCHVKALADDRERLLEALKMLAQVRHVSGSAQGTFRSNLAIVDAVLAGADVRRLEEVEAIAEGRWKP